MAKETKTQQAEEVKVTTITAKDLAGELKTDPKTLRKTLRKLSEEGLIPGKSSNWLWVSNDPAVDVIRKNFKKPVARN